MSSSSPSPPPALAPSELDESSDARWAALVAREPRADFVYAVRTTGVYCRSGCPSRLPRRENVGYYPTAGAARAAGFRSCKRCRPELAALDAAHGLLVAQLARLIEASEGPLSLADLAERAGLSAAYLQRVFKAQVGLSPQEFAAALRAERVRGELRAQPSVSAAIYAAGYSSSSRFYEHSPELLGMTPTAYRAGAPGLTIRFALGECSLGSILVAATDRGVCALFCGDEPEPLLRDLERRFPQAELLGADPAFEALAARVIGAVEGSGQGAALPLDLRGTAFQQRVWRALSAIPSGQTRTYAQVAAAIGAPSSSRAVAQACGANPVSVLIPCHRVIRKDGGISGYRWGVERKRALLAREAGAPAPGAEP